jgi:hypothetical protein
MLLLLLLLLLLSSSSSSSSSLALVGTRLRLSSYVTHSLACMKAGNHESNHA